MWSNRVYSESPHPCGHFETKIEVVTMKNISARFFQHHEPKCNPANREPHIRELNSTILKSNKVGFFMSFC